MTKLWTLHVTEAEAWAIDDLIRHTWTEEGRGIGKGLLLKVFAVLREFEARRSDTPAPVELPLALAEDECWAMEYHVRRDYVDSSGVKVGRTLLPKLFDLLLAMRNDEVLRPLRLREGGDRQRDDDPTPGERQRRLEEWRERLERDGDEPTEPGG